MFMELEKNNVKYLLMGLDNAGKTSILLSLDKNTNLMRFYSINPTRGYQIKNVENIANIISIWDFGGQAQFRSEHLQNFNRFLPQTDKLIFVIDVQDIPRYEEAIEFLNQIIHKIQEQNHTLSISIFFHKYDPGIEETLPSLIVEEIPKLEQKVREIIPKDFNLEFFTTTIFTVFHKNPL
ncbi:MAG: hypothetical protein EU533_06725 [Promethearchaeota archaeon]|nr:MAG: hypothetical protein EU533_06725 [Candidatus Lokiarchaeota archaeon]